MLKVTLLVNNDVLGQYFAEQGNQVFLDNARKVELQPVIDGQDNARTITCLLSEQEYTAITNAAAAANDFHWLPDVQPTEVPPETVPDNTFLG